MNIKLYPPRDEPFPDTYFTFPVKCYVQNLNIKSGKVTNR